MSDAEIRALERAVAQGDPEAPVALLAARLRAGQIHPDRLHAAAGLGWPAAQPWRTADQPDPRPREVCAMVRRQMRLLPTARVEALLSRVVLDAARIVGIPGEKEHGVNWLHQMGTGRQTLAWETHRDGGRLVLEAAQFLFAAPGDHSWRPIHPQDTASRVVTARTQDTLWRAALGVGHFRVHLEHKGYPSVSAPRSAASRWLWEHVAPLVAEALLDPSLPPPEPEEAPRSLAFGYGAVATGSGVSVGSAIARSMTVTIRPSQLRPQGDAGP